MILRDLLTPMRHLAASARLAQCALCVHVNARRVEHAQRALRVALDAYEKARADVLQHELAAFDPDPPAIPGFLCASDAASGPRPTAPTKPRPRRVLAHP